VILPLLIVTYCDVPQWLARLLRFDGRGIARFISLKLSEKPDWNRLISLSWRVARSRSASFLIPDNVFVRYIEERVVEEFRFGRWLEIIGAPRTGKSGGLRGVVRWVVENDIQNYVVLVVAPNRRLAENLYRYAVGAAAKLYRELRRSGVKISRGDFFARVRVRLYLCSEQSCLLGKRDHYIESCVKSCPLFSQFEKKWRRLPPVPFLDPWLLKLSGYCPFVAAFNKSFWYKSIVVLTADSL